MGSHEDKEIYLALKLSGTSKLVESSERLIDFDGSMTKLYKGIYITGGVKHDCLFTKSAGKINNLGLQFSSIKKIKHSNAVPLFNVFKYRSCTRFVHGVVHGSLRKWIEVESPWTGLFIGEDIKQPSSRFHRIVVGICGVILYLFSENLAPTSIGLDDLYVIMSGNEPVVQVLLTKVDELKLGVAKVNQQHEVWSQVKEIVKEIAKMCNAGIDWIFEKYCEFIGKTGFLAKLENYPFNWNHEKKVALIYGIIAANQNTMIQTINSTDIKWPDWPVLENIFKSGEKDAFGYITVIRNGFKHFDTYSMLVKNELESPNAFLDKVEQKNPDIWIILYEKTDVLSLL